MLLFPKKPKFIKSFSGNKIVSNYLKKYQTLKFSRIGLIAKEAGFIPNFQIEAIRLFLRRFLKKRAQLFFSIFPNQPVTKKPNEIRLGRGKGNFKYWTFYIKRGKIIIEISGYNIKMLKTALLSIKYKLSIKSYIYNKHYRWIL